MAYLARLILFAKEIVGLTHKHYISWGLFIPGFFCNATANVNPDASDRGSSE